jgi:hypothetical protein
VGLIHVACLPERSTSEKLPLIGFSRFHFRFHFPQAADSSLRRVTQHRTRYLHRTHQREKIANSTVQPYFAKCGIIEFDPAKANRAAPRFASSLVGIVGEAQQSAQARAICGGGKSPFSLSGLPLAHWLKRLSGPLRQESLI